MLSAFDFYFANRLPDPWVDNSEYHEKAQAIVVNYLQPKQSAHS